MPSSSSLGADLALIYNKHNGSTHSPIAAYAVIAAVAVFVIGYFAIRALRSR